VGLDATKTGPEKDPSDGIWRRGRESNPSRRLCRPLHNRFATSPVGIVRLLGWTVMIQINRRREMSSLNSGAGEESRTLDLNLGKVALYQLSYSRLGVTAYCQRTSWSGRRVSNSRPQPWQGCALPTELLPHGVLLLAAYILPQVTGAGEESRTLDLNLGKVALYQLSYSRILETLIIAEIVTTSKTTCYCCFNYLCCRPAANLEREKSLELSTSTLARLRSTN
jgi:hypothetical protein